MEKTADQKRAEVIIASNGPVLSNDVPQTTSATKYVEKNNEPKSTYTDTSNTHNQEIEGQVEEFKKTALFVNTINGRPDLNIPTEIHYTTTENKFRQALHTASTQAYDKGRSDKAKTCEGCSEKAKVQAKAEEREIILTYLKHVVDVGSDDEAGAVSMCIKQLSNTDVTN